MNGYLLSPAMRAGLLVAWAAVSVLACWEFYLAGAYSLVLLYLGVIPVWLLQSLLLVVRSGDRYEAMISSIGMVLLALPAFVQWITVPELGMSTILALPVLLVLLLPERWMFAFMWGVLALTTLACFVFYPFWEGVEMMLSFALMVTLVSVGTLYWQREQAARRVRFLRDMASGACNGKFLDELLEREVARCQITAGSVSLIGLMIDEYEQLKAAHSSRERHVLYRGIVRGIRNRIRRVDEVFRLQGGLWIVMLPDCREDAELVLREALTRRLEESDWQDMQQLSLTSSGVTLMPGESADDLLKRLHSRLTKQKKGHVQAAAFRL